VNKPIPFHRAAALNGRAHRPASEVQRCALADLHARLRTDAVREYLLLVARLSRKA
jgi:hypothetical protein